MNARRLIAGTALYLILATAIVVPAFAGGWAVITLDSLPEGVAPGEEFSVGFTVRQHGVTPLANLDPAPFLEVRNAATGEVVRATARDEGALGHYVARLALPSLGEWRWGIQAFGPEMQPMPPIIAAAGGSAASSPPSTGAASSVAGSSALAILAAGLALGGIALALRRRLVLSGALILLAAVAVGLWFSGTGSSSTVAEAAPPTVTADAGAALFVAKGCVVCHVNGDVAESHRVSLVIGPDLTQYANDPAFLSRWLADPAAARTGAQMPDLDLSPAEIEALIAFLNGDEDA